jgi:dipeptidyl aminopeptidase/acylaminoacyl peptidase
MSIETLERKFACPDPASLSLSNIHGSVIIQAGQVGEITIIASKHTHSGDANNTCIELFQTEAGKVIAATRYDRGRFSFFSMNLPCKVDYRVRVPTNCDLEVRGVSNTVSIDGISGNLEVKSVIGDIALQSLTGEINVITVSGKVNGADISGAANLKALSGDINITKAEFLTLRGKSVSGDFKIESPLNDGPYDFNTVSGDVRLVVPQLRGITITSNSLSGKVSTPELSKTSRNHRSIVLGDGGIEIFHKSVSGDFVLVSQDGNDPPSEISKSRINSSGYISRGEILEGISQGEISVGEALQLLIETNPEKK